MGSVRKSVTLAANATNNNVLQGTQVEWNQSPFNMRYVISGSSSVGTTRLGVQFGNRTICQPSDTLIPLETAAGVGPKIPDDVVIDAIAGPGERVLINLEDGGAGSTTRISVQTA